MFAAILLVYFLSGIGIGHGQEDSFCDSPPSVPRATLVEADSQEYAVGTEVTYACDFGYVSDGSSISSECLPGTRRQSPEWSAIRTSCIPRSCGDPGFVANARRIGSLFTFPNDVTFECEDGYKLEGSKKRFCQPSGTWSGRLPNCAKIRCAQPPNPENGRAIFTTLEYGSQLTYECSKGYAPENNEPRYCSGSGSWTGDEAVCVERSCDPPETPEHGSMELLSGQTQAGSIAIYSCDSNKILVGSTTSKCLTTGEWTFPAPECVAPCSVPAVPNGHIGKYNRRTFNKLPVGTPIQEDTNIFLRCIRSYWPMNKTKAEVKVVCKNGKWVQTPQCTPAFCDSEPPRTEHARTSTIDRRHGGSVVYSCNPNFNKTQYGAVICDFGVWRGPTPVCQDTRCYSAKIQFPGLMKEKSLFRSGESFVPRCENGYKVSRQDNLLTCINGGWQSVHLPPCKPEECSFPPAPEHGKVRNFTPGHSSVVTYECDASYKLEQKSRVTCVFGKWEGELPVCKDTRCYVKDLLHTLGLNTSSLNTTDNGERLKVSCIDGYRSSSNSIPWCSNGEWVDHTKSPCVEKKCTISVFDHGALTVTESEYVGFSFRKFRYIYNLVQKPVVLGERANVGAQLILSCKEGYTIQGRYGINNLPLTCKKGAWTPVEFICLPEGTEPAVTSGGHAVESEDGIVKNKNGQPDITTESTAVNKTPLNGHPDNLPPDSTCYCVYKKQDEKLVAYSGNEVVKFGTKVKDGCVVKFHCSHFGYARLRGQRELLCSGCRDWHSSEFPDCVDPSPGESAIFFDKEYTVLPGGIVEIPRAENVRVTCATVDYENYPLWTIYPQFTHFNVSYNRLEVDGTHIYISFMDLINTNENHNGRYGCNIQGYSPAMVDIKVKDTEIDCEDIKIDNSLRMTDENQGTTDRSVRFSCADPNHELIGSPTASCLSNGSWSHGPPKCEGKKCPEIEKSTDLTISYTNGQSIGSRAAFYCFPPYVIHGLPFVTCEVNGRWSGPITSFCLVSNCSINNLFKKIPEGVLPIINEINGDTVPYGTILKLACDLENMALAGATTAKCGENGNWDIDGAAQCISGCLPVSKSDSSTLIVTPEKEFYKFGEMVTLSCLTGQKLSIDVQRIMCLNGWSPDTIPDCI